MSNFCVLKLIVCLLTVLPASYGWGSLITYNFTAIRTGSTGVWSGQGNDVTGSISWDSDLVDTYAGDADFDLFRSHGANSGFAFDITVSLGTVTASTSDNQNLAGSYHHFLEAVDHTSEDRFRIESRRVVSSDDFARFMLRDFVPSGTPDAIATGSGNLTDTAPTALDFDKFSSPFGSFYNINNDSGQSEGILNYTVTGMTLARGGQVPEPTAFVIWSLIGGVGLVTGHRRRKA